MSTKGSKFGVGKFEKLSETDSRSDHSPSSQFSFTSPGVDSRTFRPGIMKGSQGTGRLMMKSASLSTIGLEDRQEPYIVDQADIIDLTQDVKNFSDNLAKLKAVINENLDEEESIRVVAHERLGDVLRILKNVLQRYPPLNSTELFSAAGALITKIKNFNYEAGKEGMEHAFLDAIDQLALAFSSSVSEYLMGDLQHGFEEEVKTKSYDNLLSVSHENETIQEKDEEPVSHLTVAQIDEILMSLQAGLDLALQRAKAWSKYLKDLMTYIERRAQLELEYAKNLSRLSATTTPVLTEEGFLPLQSVYCTVLSQDVDYAKTCHATLALLQSSKFIEPLTARKMEHDKVRKAVKETWIKEVKKMQETVNNQRKAHSMYVNRQQEYEKAKEQAQKVESDKLQSSGGGAQQSSGSSKVDKRKKSEEEAAHKAAESETTYKACVAEANSRQQELQKTKSQILAAVREQIYHCDETIRKVTIDYFQLLQTVSSAVPIQYSTLCEATKCYEPGSQYGEFVRRLPLSVAEPDVHEPFKFEPYSQSVRELDGRKVSGDSNTSEPSGSREGSPQVSSQRKDKYRTPAWSLVGNETDSASGSSKSLDSSPSNSPFPEERKKLTISGSVEDLDSEISSDVKQLLAVPGTFDPDAQGILKRQGQRRNTTFGVDFQEQVEQFHMAVPPIITKCLKEVERRGICLKGIYRVSGVKSRVESLCQKFENDPNSVDLQDENPNVISNVLKLYLRQLPEPLLTFRLYPDFIQLAKENMTGSPKKELVIKRLKILIDSLPFSNRKTCAVLMHHLQKVASYSDQNQMNASNLGIVFGPTLLRPQGGNASLACLVDTPHQTRVVELLIVSAQILFGPADDHEVLHGETPVEELPNEAKSRDQRQPPSDASEPRATSESWKKSSVGSVSPTEKVSDHLLPVPSANLKDTNKLSSSEDFPLPGSTESDKKNSSSGAASTVTQSNLKVLSTDGSSDSRFLNLPLPTVLPPTQMSPPPLITIEDKSNPEGQSTLVTVVKTRPGMTFLSTDSEGSWPRNPFTGVPQIAFSSEVPRASFHTGIEPLNRKKKGILAGLFMSQTPQLSRKSSTENSQGSKGGSLPTSPQSPRAASSTIKAAMASIGSFFKSSDSSKKLDKSDSKDKPDTKDKSFFRSSSFKSPKLFHKGVSLDQDIESAAIIKNTVVPENANKEKTKENERHSKSKSTRILKREANIDEERDTSSRTISVVRSLPNLAYSYYENEGSPECVQRSLSFGADDGNILIGNSVIGPKAGKQSTRSTPSPETKKSKSLSTMESIEESDVEAIESEIQGKSKGESPSHFFHKESKDSLAVVQEEDQEHVKEEQIDIIDEVVVGEQKQEGEKEHRDFATKDMLPVVLEEKHEKMKEHLDVTTKDSQAVIQERKLDLNKEQIDITKDVTAVVPDDKYEEKTVQNDLASKNIQAVAQEEKHDQSEEHKEIITTDSLAFIQVVKEQKKEQMYVVFEDSLGARQTGKHELAKEHIEVARNAPVAAVPSAYLQGLCTPAVSSSTRPKAPRTVPFGSENIHAGKENSKPTLKSHSGPIMGRSGLHPVRGNSYDLKDIKDASHSVRSSLVSSAARMRSASQKSPVTLLSYHTATISIPPGNRKPLGHAASDPVTPSAPRKVDKGLLSSDKKDKRPASFDKPRSVKNSSKEAAETQGLETCVDHVKSTDNSLKSSSQQESTVSDAYRRTDTKAKDSTAVSPGSKNIDSISSTKANSSEKKLSALSSKKTANDSNSGTDSGRTVKGSTPRKSLDGSQTKATSSAKAPVVLTVQGIRKSSLTKTSGSLLVTTPSSEKSSWSKRECMKKDTSHEVDDKKLTKENGSKKQRNKVEKSKVKLSGKVSENNSSKKASVSSSHGPSSCSKLDHSGPLKDSVSTHARTPSKSDTK